MHEKPVLPWYSIENTWKAKVNSDWYYGRDLFLPHISSGVTCEIGDLASRKRWCSGQLQWR
jgi:hypothetical protein